jgi:hypothetical protein
MPFRLFVRLLIMLALLPVAACGGTSDDTETPVATPSMAINKSRVALGSPVEVTYRFAVASNARFDQDYTVMVHFMDGDEEKLMWTDDHRPPRPTTQWKGGETVEYTRTVFMPVYPYVGPATVHMGLYSVKDQHRLPLTGEAVGQRAYKVASLELLPQSENIFLIYADGWHRAEVAPDNQTVEWQWTKKDATVSFRNPKRDALFYLRLDGRPDLFGGTQQVSVNLGGHVVDTFALTTLDEVIRKIPLTSAQLGSNDMVEIRISVDKTFVPATTPDAKSNDPRELGIRVFNAFVEPR